MATTHQCAAPEAVGQRLRLIRKALGNLHNNGLEIPQSEMARRIGTSPSAWNNAETGDNRLGLDNAMHLCAETGVTLDYVFFGNPAGLPHALAVEIDRLEKLRAG